MKNWAHWDALWRILRKNFKIWAYILHLEQVQSPVNTESRLTAYTFQLNSTEERFERILRSNKKKDSIVKQKIVLGP